MEAPKTETIDPNGDVFLVLVNAKDDAAKHSTTPHAAQELTKSLFKVSSKHLTLSSPYFKERLGLSWPDGRELAQRGVVEIQLDGFDPLALLIVLNILQSRNDRIPKKVPPTLLVKIALITNHLHCDRAVGVFGRMWFDVGRRRRNNSNQFPGYMFIRHVFGVEDHLKGCISRTWKEAEGPFDAENLPLPSFVKETVDANRQSFYDTLFSRIGRQVIQHLGPPPAASYNCETLRLGLWAKSKRPAEKRETKDNNSSPKSVSQQLWQWNNDARHICPGKSPWKFSNFEKLLGSDLVAQLEETLK